MEDYQIISLYWQRDEQAISETSVKYGRYCFTIAYNILSDKEDAEESVNDTYLSAWECIPPHHPTVLSTFLGKLVRRISLNRYRDRTRLKRGGGEIPLALDELAECISSDASTEKALELKELSSSISNFLASLQETERDIFLCRYWFLVSIQDISEKFAFSESKTKSILYRTRRKLEKHLQKEGLM